MELDLRPGEMTRESSSPSTPGFLTPPQTDTTEPPRKKRVAWKPSEHSLRTRPTSPASANPSPQHPIGSRHRGHRRLSDQQTEEDLRRAVEMVVNNEAESSTTANASRKAKPGELLAQSPRSPNQTPRPKSALRSGTATPPVTPSPQMLPVHVGIPEEEGKTLSALQARNKASRLQEHLSEDTEDALNTTNDQAGLHQCDHKDSPKLYHYVDDDDVLDSGETTPAFDEDYVPRPTRYRLGGLSAVLFNKMVFRSNPSSRASSRNGSRSASPNKMNPRIEAGSKPKRLSSARSFSEQDLTQALSKLGQKLVSPIKKRPSQEVDLRIKKHVQKSVLRQRYILLLCRCLMTYGAPTHRLEDYLRITSRILEMEAQFLYLPGCMIVSFDDSKTQTSEVKLVKASEQIDLGKLHDIHDIYKRVVHDEIGVEEATRQLECIRDKAKKFKTAYLILLHGIASMSVSPWAYQGRAMDLPIAFLLGLILGFLRLFWASKSDLYSAIFEIASVAITSFLARLFGSIHGGHLWCFSTLASSSITLILPGYQILCAALELQSRSMVAGSVRMVYALVYSLFIGFSLTIGTAIYGVMDKNAVSSAQCENPMPAYKAFAFVPLFALCLMGINQAKWKQMPLMLVIAFAGYIISFFSAKAFSDVTAVSSGLAAIGISVMANIYNRIAARLDAVVAWGCTVTWKKMCKRSASRNAGSLSEPDLEKEPSSGNRNRTTWIPLQCTKPFLDTDSISSEREQDERERRRSSDSFTKLDEPTSTDGPQEGILPHDKATSKRHISYSLAASAMLPAIFVLVPSGLSVQGSLVQGISTADQITSNITSSANTTNSTGTVTSSQLTGGAMDLQNSVAFSVGYSVIQIAIGITVGLFIGALISYPFGKGGKWAKHTRSGIFSF